MKKAFTLSEVLITLGIIGVVAALTMPSLITNHQKKQTVVQLRKVYSELQNVIKLSEIDNDPMSEWDFPQKNTYEDPEGIKQFIEKYYLPYFKSAKLVKRSQTNGYSPIPAINTNFSYYIILNNGVILAFYPCIKNDYIWLFVDLNGMKGPNRAGRDVFVFDAYKFDRIGADRYKLRFWSKRFNENDVQDLINHSEYGCRKGNTNQLKNFYCGRLIELNNWEIPANYPW